MAKVERTGPAEADLLSIAKYIAAENPLAAARWLDRIERKFALLAKQPMMGEAVDQIRPGLRRFSYGQYLIFFEPRHDGINLIRVLHGARKIEDLF